MDLLLQQFYDFLKEKYGKPGTECLNPVKTIHCKMDVEIPGFSKNNPRHTWSVHLETSIENAQKHRLILGTRWPDRRTSWSRYIQIESQPSCPMPFFSVIENIHFKKEHNLGSLIAFIKVWEEFFEILPVEA